MALILRENEKILKSVHQDRVFLLPRLLGWASIVVVFFVWRYYGNFEFWGQGGVVLSVITGFAIVAIFHKLYLWYQSSIVCTNQRLVCSVQTGIFSRMTIELLYRDIKEVSVVREGIYASIFRYGDLHIATASDTVHVFERIPRPDAIVDIIHMPPSL